MQHRKQILPMKAGELDLRGIIRSTGHMLRRFWRFTRFNYWAWWDALFACRGVDSAKSFAHDSPILLTLSQRPQSALRPPGKSSFIHMLPVRSTEPATNRVTELKNIYGILHFALKSNFIFLYISSKIRHKTCPHTQCHPSAVPLLIPALIGAESSVWLAGRTPVPANWKAGAVNSALHFICIWRRRWASVLPDSPVRASTVATGSRGVPSVSIE